MVVGAIFFAWAGYMFGSCPEHDKDPFIDELIAANNAMQEQIYALKDYHKASEQLLDEIDRVDYWTDGFDAEYYFTARRQVDNLFNNKLDRMHSHYTWEIAEQLSDAIRYHRDHNVNCCDIYKDVQEFCDTTLLDQYVYAY